MSAKFRDTIGRRSGQVIAGASASALVAGVAQTLYADAGLTEPLGTAIQSNNNGLIEFFVPDGTYEIEYSNRGVVIDLFDEVIFNGAALKAQVGDFSVDVSGIATGVKGFNIATSVANTLFMRPSINVAGGTVFKSSSPDFTTDKPLEFIASTILFEPSQTFRTLPLPGSFAHAIDVVQTSPTSGSTAGPVYFNKMDITLRSKITGVGGLPGLPGSATIAGFQVGLNVGGANFDATQAFGISGGISHTLADTSSSDKVGVSGGVYSNASSNGIIFGGSSGVTADTNSNIPQMVGHEADVSMFAGATVPYRYGFNAANQGTGRASLIDAAYAVQSCGPAGTIGGSWNIAMALVNNNGALPKALGPNAKLVWADHALTFSNVIDLPTASVSGQILNFANVQLSALGALALNTTSAGIGLGDVVSTSAWLNVAPSTTAKASIRVQPGVAPTTPVSGNIYSNGTHLYWVDATGTARQLDN